jgi:hypothetical protein
MNINLIRPYHELQIYPMKSKKDTKPRETVPLILDFSKGSVILE